MAKHGSQNQAVERNLFNHRIRLRLKTHTTPDFLALSALDADKSPEWRLQMNELNKLRRNWVADLEHFTSVLKRSDVPKKTVDIFVDAFDPMVKRIAQMQNRAMTGD